MTTVAWIPSRGGSTRIPRKNLADINGRTLLQRAIEVGLATCDRVVVSTDDGGIAAVAIALGAEVHLRPAELATEHAQIEPAIAHWLQPRALSPDDVVVLLQPTSPNRRADTVRQCIDLVRSGYDSALAVTADVRRAIFAGSIEGERVEWDRPRTERPRTQDVRDVAVETGSVYAFTVRHFLATGSRMGGREAIVRVPWLEAFDIDTPEELAVARLLAPLADRWERDALDAEQDARVETLR